MVKFDGLICNDKGGWRADAIDEDVPLFGFMKERSVAALLFGFVVNTIFSVVDVLTRPLKSRPWIRLGLRQVFWGPHQNTPMQYILFSFHSLNRQLSKGLIGRHNNCYLNKAKCQRFVQYPPFLTCIRQPWYYCHRLSVKEQNTSSGINSGHLILASPSRGMYQYQQLPAAPTMGFIIISQAYSVRLHSNRCHNKANTTAPPH
jgi:hypothetical protein